MKKLEAKCHDVDFIDDILGIKKIQTKHNQQVVHSNRLFFNSIGAKVFLQNVNNKVQTNKAEKKRKCGFSNENLCIKKFKKSQLYLPFMKKMKMEMEENSTFKLFDKLKELYIDLVAENSYEINKLNLKNTSFLLDKLVIKEGLNTLILNLYPGNKGYSLAFKGTNRIIDLSNSQDSAGNANRNKHQGGIISYCNDKLQETMTWPYEEEDLLECINNEELPLVLIDMFETKCPNLFYSGCVIVEVRDYRQSFPKHTCDTYHVLLKPTNQTILADINLITSEGDWSYNEKLALESQLVLATAEPLCLNPDPTVGIQRNNYIHQRYMFNTVAIKRQAKKFTQVSINRKRKIDQFTHNFGLELNDFMNRYRHKPRHQLNSTITSSVNVRLPPKPTEAIQQIKTPSLNLPSLSPPLDVYVEKYAKAYERPRETVDCMPQLIEEYILETDRGSGRVYHIKLSIFQRPANNEYLGELYVDRDYKENERNGEACQFSLGTRAHANRYIQQFTEIFTEEGRKKVKITHVVPGQAPRVTCTAGMWEHKIQQAAIQHPQQQYFDQISQIQQQNQTSKILPTSSVNTSSGDNCKTLISIGNIQIPQQQLQLYTTRDKDNSNSKQQISMTPAQLSLGNSSLVFLQQELPGNISNFTVATTNRTNSNMRTNSQKFNSTTPQSRISTTVPVMGENSTEIRQEMIPESITAAIHSNNSSIINTFGSKHMNSPSQCQQQMAVSKSLKVTNNNSAIISLLNSAPAAMTNSSVINNTLTGSPSPTYAISTGTELFPPGSAIDVAIHPISNLLNNSDTNNIRAIPVQSSQHIQSASNESFNSSNVTTFSSDLLSQGQSICCQQNKLTIIPNSEHQLPTKVTMSALATQLASPPALMTNSVIKPIKSNLNTTANINSPSPSTVIGGGNMKPQHLVMSSANSKIISQVNIRRNIVPTPSCTNESVTSLTFSDSNVSLSMPGFSASPLTPSLSSIADDLLINNSMVIERLSEDNSQLQQIIQRNSNVYEMPPSQLAAQSPKNLSQPHQQPKHNFPVSISSLSSSPPSNKCSTLNLQGLNLSSLQGTMATIPGLHNVQVQIPRLSQSISLSFTNSGATFGTLNTQSANLKVSLPLSTSQVNTIQTMSSAIPTCKVLNSSTQSVVLANNQISTTGSMLSLPIAQLVTSGIKSINPQRTRNPTSTLNNSIQLLGTIQMPRNNTLTSVSPLIHKSGGLKAVQKNMTGANSPMSGVSPLAKSQELHIKLPNHQAIASHTTVTGVSTERNEIITIDNRQANCTIQTSIELNK